LLGPRQQGKDQNPRAQARIALTPRPKDAVSTTEVLITCHRYYNHFEGNMQLPAHHDAHSPIAGVGGSLHAFHGNFYRSLGTSRHQRALPQRHYGVITNLATREPGPLSTLPAAWLVPDNRGLDRRQWHGKVGADHGPILGPNAIFYYWISPAGE